MFSINDRCSRTSSRRAFRPPSNLVPVTPHRGFTSLLVHVFRLRYVIPVAVSGTAFYEYSKFKETVNSWTECAGSIFSWTRSTELSGPKLQDTLSDPVHGSGNLLYEVHSITASLSSLIEKGRKSLSSTPVQTELQHHPEKNGPPKNSSDPLYSTAANVLSSAIAAAVRAAEVRADEIPDQQESDGGLDNREELFLENQLNEHLRRTQDELMEMQVEFQHKLDHLEQENRELRKQLMLLRGEDIKSLTRKTKKTLIDMYSEILSMLNEYDNNYSIHDHLPRIVVIGDQSSGKTSVLEMLAQVRIFPRGSGEMMTRSPVMVTLSEGPHHIAFFKDSDRMYDLAKESEVTSLRNEIESKMKSSIPENHTISQEVISLQVKGPGLHRMVLVDLPGIISSVTTEMNPETKQNILDLCRRHLENPNTIILCVQDGSVDAERSTATDIVEACDPSGQRTFVVVTKLDLAEKYDVSPQRVKKLLSGQLLRMKALGYYAVVAGTGSSRDTIEGIRHYEETYFKSSAFFKSGVFKASQVSSQNLSHAISRCFWDMVCESVKLQSRSLQSQRFSLETEWRNSFPSLRELDRNELFERARVEILDNLRNLVNISSSTWEKRLYDNLCKVFDSYLLNNVYYPASAQNTGKAFRTVVDIELKKWMENSLPNQCIQVGWKTLVEIFEESLENLSPVSSNDVYANAFRPLKNFVVNQLAVSFSWSQRAVESLQVILQNALDDCSVSDQASWDDAYNLMNSLLSGENRRICDEIATRIGPTTLTSWLRWVHRTHDQDIGTAINAELMKMIKSPIDHGALLGNDEITVIRKNLQARGMDIPASRILEMWNLIYLSEKTGMALDAVRLCRKSLNNLEGCGHYIGCSDLVLFWRVQRMILMTSNVLRQQITNSEARRLEARVNEVLEKIADDDVLKTRLICGRVVDVAEELKRVRHVQEKLDAFAEALQQEKEKSKR